MARIDDLMAVAFDAIPSTGEIPVQNLVSSLKTSGNGDAVVMLEELKKRGLIKSKLEFIDGGIVHTYSRVPGATL